MVRLERALRHLPQLYPGPGGAVAVLRRGEVLARHAWGWANAERRIAFTPRTLFRMCSITKQFTCALLLDRFSDPTVLDADLGRVLPRLQQPPPTILDLCHNQSGLRDYWAVAMLQGSPIEAPFDDADAARLIAGTRRLQFAPGSRYSYANQNFRILSDILQHRTGRCFSELLRERIFAPSGMLDAFLAADTRAMPDGTVGYEGSQTTGFREAENRILWTGDAGLGASLDDMIAWERWIDACRDDPEALYNRLAAPVCFADGKPAAYGFGLARRTQWGRLVTGHGGALRGWRSHRLHVAADRVSVVVMFNHLSDAQAAALDLLAAVLDEDVPPSAGTRGRPDWLGAYREPETGLAARIDQLPEGTLRLRFGHVAERLELQPDGTATQGLVRLQPQADGLWLQRLGENLCARLEPLSPMAPTHPTGAAGSYHCDETCSTLTIAESGGALYGAFSGPLGKGRMELLEAMGNDVWALSCPRALDHTPPGDWTLALSRDDRGCVREVEVGCWLARGLRYRPIDAAAASDARMKLQ